jgi:hypothetical protein
VFREGRADENSWCAQTGLLRPGRMGEFLASWCRRQCGLCAFLNPRTTGTGCGLCAFLTAHNGLAAACALLIRAQWTRCGLVRFSNLRTTDSLRPVRFEDAAARRAALLAVGAWSQERAQEAGGTFADAVSVTGAPAAGRSGRPAGPRRRSVPGADAGPGGTKRAARRGRWR